jgi:predicted esterase
MFRSLDVRRLARRAIAPVCASLTVVLIALFAVSISSGGARAQAAAVRGAPARPAVPSIEPRTSAAVRPPLAPPLPTARQRITSASGADVFVYPPTRAGAGSERPEPSPLVVMLHGMCCDPAPTCDFWSPAGREGSFLVCPEGNASCGGAASWEGPIEAKAAALDQSLAAVDAAFGAHIAHAKGDILMGFSRGAFVARDVVYARPGRFKGLILIGALMRPDAARFKAAGIRRVVMAAGEYDMARPAMQRAAAELTANGLPARYVSLGRIGHALPDNMEEIMRGALRWVREGIPAGEGAGS